MARRDKTVIGNAWTPKSLQSLTPMQFGEKAKEAILAASDSRNNSSPSATRPKTKGERGGECNRTDCTHYPAMFFNLATRAFYCQGCAYRINEGTQSDRYPCIHPREYDRITKDGNTPSYYEYWKLREEGML